MPRYSEATVLLFIIAQGNIEAAFNLYLEALEMAAAEEKLHTLPSLYVHFSRLKYMVGCIYSSAFEHQSIKRFKIMM